MIVSDLAPTWASCVSNDLFWARLDVVVNCLPLVTSKLIYSKEKQKTECG